MTVSVRLQKPAAKPGVPAAANSLLQRKCACGETASYLTGECNRCSNKRIGVQSKPLISAMHDPRELEADRVSDQVTAMPTQAMSHGARPQIQHFGFHPSLARGGIPPSVEQTLASHGRPLEPALRRNMEERFACDFSKVRIHTDATAARSAHDMNAHAYTAGQHIVFGGNRFAPGTTSGTRLLAHELTHVVQQSTLGGSGRPTSIMRKGFESTVEVCHRVLESRKFEVANGGVRVVLIATSPDTSIPNCRDFDFGVTLTRSEDWWPDDEIGTCEAKTGGARTFTFANIPSGAYYLTFWRVFDHPYCCLEGDVLVFDEPAASDGTGCKRDKDLTAMEIVHGALDIAGFIPVLGAIPDGVNAAIYVVEGDWANAGLSAVAMVPAWGDGVKLGAMAGKSVIKISGKAAFKLGEEGIALGLKEVKAASKAEKAAIEATEEAAKVVKAEKEGAEAAIKTEKEAVATATKTEKEAAEKAGSRPDKPEKKKKSKKPRCTQAEIDALNAALHQFCDKPRRCRMQLDTCETATAKIAAGYGCVDGRVVLQQRCFRKGDPLYEEHMQQIAQVYAAIRNCESIAREKCK